jgi:hypothetical protein
MARRRRLFITMALRRRHAGVVSGPVVVHIWWGKWSTIFCVKLNGFTDDLAQLGEYILGIVTVTATDNKSWATPDKALILFRPIYDFSVAIRFTHFWLSSIAYFTIRSWYFFASSPSLPETVTTLATFGWEKFLWLPFPPRFSNPAFSRSAINSRTFLGIRFFLLPSIAFALFLVVALASMTAVSLYSHLFNPNLKTPRTNPLHALER